MKRDQNKVDSSLERVVVYIDGFNLYYGLRSKGWRRYYWLDLCRLSRSLLRARQRLVMVRYFTAGVLPEPADLEKPTRQNTYLEALATLPDLHLHYGYHMPKRQHCPNCGAIWQSYEEKMTDVNIAVEMLGDALDNTFDTAIVVSADSDLTRPVIAVRERFPKKRIVAAFPPNRASKHLRKAATASFTIGRDALRDSQLPDRVVKPDGYVLTRPPRWT